MIEAFIASAFVASLSLLGVFLFGRHGRLQGAHRYVLPVAIGVFLGVVFFELIPETIETSHKLGPVAIVVGFFGFYVLSYFLRAFHHHHDDALDGCIGDGARKLLIGDAIHNITDGVVIATAFLVNPTVGVATTIGIALHEIPQEIAEFGVLMQSGFSTKKAALYNLLSASSIVLGVLFVVFFAKHHLEWLFILTGIAAGNLLYIAIGDLLPELQKSHKEHFWHTFIAAVLGVVLIGMLISYAHELTGEEHSERMEVYNDTNLQ